MIRIVRRTLDGELAARLERLTEEIGLEAPERQYVKAQTVWRRTTTRRDVHHPLRDILGTMAPGRQYCMYCGDNQGTDIDHFEPVARSPLRTFDWLNHLLACSVCNSHHKRDVFPVAADGTPLLIDPSADDPFDHLMLTLTLGRYIPLTERGEVTIEVCRLNRPLLTRGRQAAYEVVVMSLYAWHRAQGDGSAVSMRKAIVTVREQPFAEVCQSMLRQAVGPGASIVFGDGTQTLELLREPELRTALLAA